MTRTMLGRRVPAAVIRDALIQLLAKQDEPASTRDLVTAVYHLTGEDRVGYGNVTQVLRAMTADGAARRTAAGMWEAAS